MTTEPRTQQVTKAKAKAKAKTEPGPRPAAPASQTTPGSPSGPMRVGNASLFLPSLLLLTDLLVLECAFLFVYWARFWSGWFPVPKGVPDLQVYLIGSIGVLGVFVGLLYAHSMYDLRRRQGVADDLGGLGRTVIEALLLLAAAAFFYRGFSFSRTFLIGFATSSYVFLVCGRVFARYLLRVARSTGVGVERVALLGRGAQQDRLVQLLQSRAGLGYTLVGEVLQGTDEPGRLQVLGHADDLATLVDHHDVDVLLVTAPFHNLERVLPILEILADHQIRILVVPDLDEILASNVRVYEIEGLPFMELRQVALRGIDRVVKRTFDLALSVLFLVTLSPALVVIAAAVRLSSKGPALFRQERIGRDGRVFGMLKFRTMQVDAERHTGPVFATPRDPRRTRMGQWLRSFSLDELPQLYNVLCGDMSLVGPRPERPVFVEEFRASIPRYFERHKVRSGITGWAQVNGLRGGAPLGERTRYDIYYVENWSLGFDLKILAMTLRSVVSRRNAY